MKTAKTKTFANLVWFSSHTCFWSFPWNVWWLDSRILDLKVSRITSVTWRSVSQVVQPVANSASCCQPSQHIRIVFVLDEFNDHWNHSSVNCQSLIYLNIFVLNIVQLLVIFVKIVFYSSTMFHILMKYLYYHHISWIQILRSGRSTPIISIFHMGRSSTQVRRGWNFQPMNIRGGIPVIKGGIPYMFHRIHYTHPTNNRGFIYHHRGNSLESLDAKLTRFWKNCNKFPVRRTKIKTWNTMNSCKTIEKKRSINLNVTGLWKVFMECLHLTLRLFDQSWSHFFVHKTRTCQVAQVVSVLHCESDFGLVKNVCLENIVYHNCMQLWLVLGVKLMEINSNLFSRWWVIHFFIIRCKVKEF